ncbi:MAG: glycosyltransferase family 9 protein [Syntrophales bacterium]
MKQTKTAKGPSFLIVSLRYSGDVLLSTPLSSSIKKRLPEATIDYLVFEGTQGVLCKNPHVRTVLTVPPESKDIRFFASIWKRYDYSIGTNPSDRTNIHCAGTGRTSIGFSYFTPHKDWWKKIILSQCRFYNDQMHIVPLILTQLELLGIPAHPRVVMGHDKADEEFVRTHLGEKDYIILHPYSRKDYKYWPPQAWATLASLIREKLRLKPVFTVSPNPAEAGVLKDIMSSSHSSFFAFHQPYNMCQLAAAIKGSMGFIGVDTVVTHIAAAMDISTIALFGPSLARHWGPWSNDSSAKSPYTDQGGMQRSGVVTIMKKDWACVPCNKETCEISNDGRMECMAAITPEEVFDELVNMIKRS